MIKQCEFCKKDFEVSNNAHGKKRRFCSTSCSAKWRLKTYGPVKVSAEGKKRQSEALKKQWKSDEFRRHNYERMKYNNPVYKDGVIEKANQTRLKNGLCKNNFKYGNGKISNYESIAKDYLQNYNFYYNYAIPTKIARHAFPQEHFAVNYKPDFVNLEHKICIEIDGTNHNTHSQKLLDAKKEKCLEFLGFKIYRFTHEQIKSGEFYLEVDKIWQNW